MIEYLKSKNIPFEDITENLYLISNKKFLFLEERSTLINSKFEFKLTQEEGKIECDFYAFKWGTRYYYSPIDKVQFIPLLYIGKSNDLDTIGYSNLGIHGKYELLNGTRVYEDWVKKAKFYGHESLGIAEKQTFAGAIQFQKACESEGIKSILGSTGMLKVKNEKQLFPIKYYVKDKYGWKSALNLNKIQNVDRAEDPYLAIEDINNNSEGLIIVSSPIIPYRILKVLSSLDDIYMQIDLSELHSNKLDMKWLDSTKKYIDNPILYKKIPPVVIQDSYYLEPEDSEAKSLINRISKSNDNNYHKDHYYKSANQIMEEMLNLNLQEHVILEAFENNTKIVENCNFKIDLKSRHLPKYEMNNEESSQYSNNKDLFYGKINEGLESRVVTHGKDIEPYLERIEREVNVLEKGGVTDYFLINADICRYCDNNGILRGHGRGSAAGSLVAYLLGITEVDPLEYDLLFERFLDEGRIKGELPDIDIDFSDRDAVKRYLEEKYGYDYVCSIGTYGNYKIKNLFGDICSDSNIDAGVKNYMSKIVTKEYENGGFSSLMECCAKNKKIRDFINDNIADKVDFYNALLGQPKSKSVHASGVIVVPKEDEEGNPIDIYSWMPVKKMEGHLVSEWEGRELEGAGFLKEDLLGLNQLEKFSRILELIKKNHDKEINIFDIPLDEREVFNYFSNGITEDVFQFGTSGLKAYCASLKPENVNELASANALYRPGAMESNAHTDFIKLKFGEKEPEYDYMLKEVTKETGGLYIFQEQIMKACQVLGGFSLTDANGIRKAMGKKILDKMESYKIQFLAGAKERGCDEETALSIWNKLEVFAGYGFNRSHAVCYSIIGYISEWFKVNYPLEFWMTSLEKAKDDERPNRLKEINQHFDINIKAVDINKSGLKFELDKETNSIYYSISSVKFVGEQSVEKIMEERKENGSFFSLLEFIDRIPKKYANKRVITNLILCGAFDEIEGIKKESDRLDLLLNWSNEKKIKGIEEEYESKRGDNFWFQIQKYQLSGIGYLNYKEQAEELGINNFSEDISTEDFGEYVTVAGECVEIEKKNNGNGNWAILTLNCNNLIFKVLAWQNFYKDNMSEILKSKGRFLFIDGSVKEDYFNPEEKNISCNQNSKLIIL